MLENIGSICYKVRYVEEVQTLVVTVVECKGLKKMDLLGKSDPFVRVFLMPGTHNEQKTKVIKRNLNPVFDEVFKFVVSSNLTSVMKKTVVLRVYDKDRLRSDEIG